MLGSRSSADPEGQPADPSAARDISPDAHQPTSPDTAKLQEASEMQYDVMDGDEAASRGDSSRSRSCAPSELEEGQVESDDEDARLSEEGAPQPTASQQVANALLNVVRQLTSCGPQSGDPEDDADADALDAAESKEKQLDSALQGPAAPHTASPTPATPAAKHAEQQQLLLPEHFDSVQRHAPATPDLWGANAHMPPEVDMRSMHALVPAARGLPLESVQEEAEVEEETPKKPYRCTLGKRGASSGGGFGCLATLLEVLVVVVAIVAAVALWQLDVAPQTCGVNITTVLTPERRREEFRGQLNGLLAAGGHQVQLQAVAVHEAEWTLALHSPQQRLNASLVLQDLKSKALLGRHTHVVFMMPHNLLSGEPPRTAQDMTSDSVISDLKQAVEGCSSWYYPTKLEQSDGSVRTFERLNKPAVENILKVAEVNCPRPPQMVWLSQLEGVAARCYTEVQKYVEAAYQSLQPLRTM